MISSAGLRVVRPLLGAWSGLHGPWHSLETGLGPPFVPEGPQPVAVTSNARERVRVDSNHPANPPYLVSGDSTGTARRERVRSRIVVSWLLELCLEAPEPGRQVAAVSLMEDARPEDDPDAPHVRPATREGAAVSLESFVGKLEIAVRILGPNLVPMHRGVQRMFSLWPLRMKRRSATSEAKKPGAST
jgi:hypothetical protein